MYGKSALWDTLEVYLGIVLFIFGVTVAFFVFVGVMTLVSGLADRATCRNTAEAMGVNWSWRYFQECMIQVDGKLIPLSAYKVVKVDRN